MGQQNSLTEYQQGDLAPLTAVEQAAIVLMSMGEEPAASVLQRLSRDELLAVTNTMSRLSSLKVSTVKQVLQEFFDDYREQSGVYGASRPFLKRSLDLALGKNIADTVLDRIYGDAIRPKIARLQWASPKWLAEHIANEHPRMQAVFLAFLPSEMAGRLLDVLPMEIRDVVLLNVARLNEIGRDVLIELEELVDRYLDNLNMQSSAVEGVQLAADILNRLPANRQQMFELLRAHDPEVVSRIEDSMYDFFILSRQTDVVLTRIIEEVPLDQWAIALKGAEPAVRNAIMQTMPRRQQQTFEEIMLRVGPIPISRVMQMREAIMKQVKALVDAGEIEVQLFAEAVIE